MRVGNERDRHSAPMFHRAPLARFALVHRDLGDGGVARGREEAYAE